MHWWGWNVFFAFACLSRKEQPRVFLFFIQRLSARYIASVRQLETLHYHLAETDQRSWHHLFLFFFSGIVKSTLSLSFSLSLSSIAIITAIVIIVVIIIIVIILSSPAIGKIVTPMSAMLMFRKMVLLLLLPKPPELEQDLIQIS